MSGMNLKVTVDDKNLDSLIVKLQQLKKEKDSLTSQLIGTNQAIDPKLFAALSTQLQKVTKDFDALGTKISKYVAEQEAAKKATQNTSDSLLNYIKRGAALAGITFGVDKIRDLGSEIMNVRNQFQQLEIAFGTMLKSTDKAATLMKDLTKFAAETPFGLQSAASGAKQLLAYGSTADTVIKELTMLGDVAAGTGQQIGDLVYLYGTLRTQGRAYLMDIRQFAGRGIPIYDELAKVLNTSKDKVNEFVSAGKVGFKEVEQAFKNMTAQGGLYGGLMEEQSKSIGGRMEALKDNISSILNQIGKDSEGFIYKSIDGINTLVENHETVGKVLLGLVATYGIATAAEKFHIAMMMVQATSTTTVTGAKAAQIVVTNALTAAQNRLNTSMLANPYVLAAAAVVALGYGIYKLATYQTEAEKAQSRLNETTKEYESNIEGEKVKLDILFGRLKSAKEGTDKYKEAKQGILDIADSYHLSIDKDIDLVKEEIKYRNILNAAIIETAKAKAIESGTQKATEIYTKTWGDAISDIRKRFIKTFGESQGELLLDSLKESLSEGKDLTNEVQDAIGKFSTTYYGSSVTGGGSTTLNPVQQLVTNVQLSKKALDKEVSDLEGVFGKLKKSTDEGSQKTAKSLQDQIFSATKNVQDLKNELKDLQKGIIPDASIEDASFDFAKTIEEKTKSLKEAEDKLSYLLYGKSSSGQSKADSKAESGAEKARKASLKLLNLQAELDSESVKQQLEYEQKLLDIEQDSFDKRYRQNQLNMAKELIATEEFRQKMIKDQQEAAKNIYVKEHGSDTGFNFATFDKTPQGLSDADIESQIKKRTDASLAAWKKGNEDIAKEQKAFSDEENLTFASQLDQQIYSIRRHYQERRDLAKGNSELIKQIVKNENREIIEARLQAHQRQLESDADYNQKYQELVSDRYVFESDKRKASLEQQIKDQKKIFNDLEKQVFNDPNNSELANQLRDAFIRLKILNKELEKTPAEKLGEIAGIFNQISSGLSDITGVDFSIIGNTLSGVASFASKDYLGAATTGFSLISGFVSGIISKKEREAQIQREINKLQQQYNIDLRQQNYDLISSIDYARAFRDNLEALQWLVEKGFISDIDYSAWEAFNKQSEEANKNILLAQQNYDKVKASSEEFLNEAYRLRNEPVWSKYKDIVEDWKSGLISTEEAQRRLGVAGVKGATEAADAIARAEEETQKWKDRVAELSQQMDEFATGTSFDSFLSDASNTISEFRGDISSLADFTEEKLTNAILSSFKYQILSNALKPMYDELADMLLSGSYDASAANDWRQRLTDILNTNSKELDKIFSAFGIDPEEVGNSSQSPSRGGFETMSQDTATALEGRFTGMQMNLISIDQNVARIAQWNQPFDTSKFNLDGLAMPLGALSQSSLRIERMIEENRNIAISSYYELKDINKQTKELYAIREGIDAIKKNTDGLV